jgi:hypothetical protein
MIFRIKYLLSVKIKNLKTWWIIFFVFLCDLTTSAQFTSGVLQQYLLENLKDKRSGIIYRKNIQEFDTLIHYQTAWIQQKDTENLNRLLDNLSSAPYWGLSEKDYQYGFISAHKNGTYLLKS